LSWNFAHQNGDDIAQPTKNKEWTYKKCVVASERKKSHQYANCGWKGQHLP